MPGVFINLCASRLSHGGSVAKRGIIGGKAFVSATYRKVKEAFQAKRDKIPKPVSGLGGIYSLKRLTE